MATSDSPEATEHIFGLGALMSDLKRLEAKAMSQGFLITATLIGAAAEAVADEMVQGLEGPAGKLNGEQTEAAQLLAKRRPAHPHGI